MTLFLECDKSWEQGFDAAIKDLEEGWVELCYDVDEMNSHLSCMGAGDEAEDPSEWQRGYIDGLRSEGYFE